MGEGEGVGVGVGGVRCREGRCGVGVDEGVVWAGPKGGGDAARSTPAALEPPPVGRGAGGCEGAGEGEGAWVGWGEGGEGGVGVGGWKGCVRGSLERPALPAARRHGAPAYAALCSGARRSQLGVRG